MIIRKSFLELITSTLYTVLIQIHKLFIMNYKIHALYIYMYHIVPLEPQNFYFHINTLIT